MPTLTVYVASSFKHLHAVRLLNRALRGLDCHVLDWSEKATPPEGLNAAQRREWMDTDHGGEVFIFCAQACQISDLVLYLGASGQDAGVEVGMASAAGKPVLGIRGPLESPGLMLHGAVTAWSDSVEEALARVESLVAAVRNQPALREPEALKSLLRRTGGDHV